MDIAENTRHLADFRRKIAAQEERISVFESDGHDTALSKALLVTFLETLRLGEDHRRQILDAIAGKRI